VVVRTDASWLAEGYETAARNTLGAAGLAGEHQVGGNPTLHTLICSVRA
jgi:hypothetical protein